MDYKKLIKNVHKYHLYATTTNHTIFLSSSNSKTRAKLDALYKLKPNIDNLIGKKLVLVHIKSVNKEFEKQKTSEDLKIIGGPIVFIFKIGLIKSKYTIKDYEYGSNNKVYLSEKYIKKHNDNIVINLKKLVGDFVSLRFNQGLLNMTIL